jgi:hypothetical protein
MVKGPVVAIAAPPPSQSSTVIVSAGFLGFPSWTNCALNLMAKPVVTSGSVMEFKFNSDVSLLVPDDM